MTAYKTPVINYRVCISKHDFLVGLVFVRVPVDLEVLGSIPRSDIVLFGSSIRNLSVSESEFVPVLF